MSNNESLSIETRKEHIKRTEECFKLGVEVISSHLGPFHPLLITLYSLMCSQLVQKQKWDDALYLYKSSIMISIKSLGQNHVRTAQLFVDLGQFFLRQGKLTGKDMRDQALLNFEQAYSIYEIFFENNAQMQAQKPLLADISMQIASIMEEQNRLMDAQMHA